MAKISAAKGVESPSSKALKMAKSAPPKAKTSVPLKNTSLRKLEGPTVAQKKANVERKAVIATRNKLYRRGYTSVRELHHNKIHGVDIGAIKYGKEGRLLEGAVVEVKGRSAKTPGPSAFKKQVRPSYYLPRLELAKKKGVKGADQLLDLHKQGNLRSFGATYGLQDKGKGARIYNVGKCGPISKKPLPTLSKHK